MTDSLSARHRKIIEAVRAIPRGRVSSYGQVAQRAGLPGRARLVGKVLRDLDEGQKVPWHRVVRAGGGLAFPPDSEAYAEQVQRLQRDGVNVVRGRVPRLHWEPIDDMDAQIWGQPF